jgi:cytochrome c oxidase cbb3-type subunit I
VTGGVLYLAGMLIMAWNTWMTVAQGRSVRVPVAVPQAA